MKQYKVLYTLKYFFEELGFIYSINRLKTQFLRKNSNSSNDKRFDLKFAKFRYIIYDTILIHISPRPK